jgi:hypothetical protein
MILKQHKISKFFKIKIIINNFKNNNYNKCNNNNNHSHNSIYKTYPQKEQKILKLKIKTNTAIFN